MPTTTTTYPACEATTRHQQANQPQQSTTNHHQPDVLPSIPPTSASSRSSAPVIVPIILVDGHPPQNSKAPISRILLVRLSCGQASLAHVGFASAPLSPPSPQPRIRWKLVVMAARGPAAARGINNRFAQFKLVLLGESAVGKSSIVLRFVKDQFDSFRESTIGAAFLTQTISLDENTTVKFEIWDTAGQERYKSLAPMYYRNANCAVVVYDITQSSSLDKAKAWVKELQRQANENIIIALAGNKLDLVNQQPDKRAISTNEAEAYAREAGLLFFETSAKTAENVRELFTAIAKKLPLDQVGPRHARPGQRPGVSLNPENANTNVSGPCSC
ncbi:hypothetical protein XA68_16900 [Ophiocordyceps unilateralis]|uniref:GTP-binding protein ypt5 n=1 Tax=Ophiocordyceps unilateralis TaxID=268505 RepID=A0A2A9P5S5_OPHUN|nr:hypothetical protein XA68_16900 [Ophiocordyceps unilateralis]